MKLKKTNSQHVFASMEQASFTKDQIGGEITVSQEGLMDFFGNIKEAWTNWRMARIGKRKPLTPRDIQALKTWGYSAKRQISRTYGEPRWVSQKIDPEVSEIQFAEFNQLMTLAGTGQIASFTDITQAMIKLDEDVTALYEGIEKYFNMIGDELTRSDDWFRNGYREMDKIVKMLGSPRDFVKRHIDNISKVPNNYVIKYEPESRNDVFSFIKDAKDAPATETIPALQEKEFRGFAEMTNRLIGILTDSNYLNDDLFFTRDMILEQVVYENDHGDQVVDRSAEEAYNNILRNAYSQRNTDVIEALSPEFWNATITTLVSQYAELCTDIASMYIEYMNRHLKGF